MTTLQIWLALIGLTLVTILTRGFFLLWGNRFELPESVQNAIRYAPMAALIAIIVPELLINKDASEQSLNWLGRVDFSQPQFLAGVIAILAHLYIKNMALTIGIGVAVFMLLRAI
ncbi:MAG: AzlD domain-containing protein [Burkholderiaceae bacterium]|jgi:branched-subunit amino acid transport protein|uniref:AzlD domain-containing protein n=1 Tax=Polynucleobacter sp. MWH-Loch1C5 TaxID=2689108 RepID=UPI001C0D191A|nr:AzlD domain-containing protein [Polynucleobacter sp. MWH-Loch1C5]MBU3542706.1 AzlD domain-containing protein [Polynucleobacter sp. MWH-Loch1C5]NBV00253.1 AzlD domain-containing protein [Burkholderiaceae bacterium]